MRTTEIGNNCNAFKVDNPAIFFYKQSNLRLTYEDYFRLEIGSSNETATDSRIPAIHLSPKLNRFCPEISKYTQVSFDLEQAGAGQIISSALMHTAMLHKLQVVHQRIQYCIQVAAYFTARRYPKTTQFPSLVVNLDKNH